ncbi:MAG: hypothetical protein QM613_02060 [Micrococcaceae bacterium]
MNRKTKRHSLIYVISAILVVQGIVLGTFAFPYLHQIMGAKGWLGILVLVAFTVIYLVSMLWTLAVGHLFFRKQKWTRLAIRIIETFAILLGIAFFVNGKVTSGLLAFIPGLLVFLASFLPPIVQYTNVDKFFRQEVVMKDAKQVKNKGKAKLGRGKAKIDANPKSSKGSLPLKSDASKEAITSNQAVEEISQSSYQPKRLSDSNSANSAGQQKIKAIRNAEELYSDPSTESIPTVGSRSQLRSSKNRPSMQSRRRRSAIAGAKKITSSKHLPR